MQATLRLFRAVQVEGADQQSLSADLVARTIQHGYILEPQIHADEKLLKLIESTIGLSGSEVNAAFHKSWKTIQESSLESLVAQQVTHYLTTYGFEHLGVFQSQAVYIPREQLEIPELESDLPVVVIRAMNSAQILKAIVELGSGIALADETLNDIMTIVQANRYDQSFVQEIGNRELKTRLMDYYGIVPTEPVEFLRHLISKLTDTSLLIKNESLIQQIKAAKGKNLDELLKQAPENLASIFFRYKPLFLAMRSISGNKRFFNRLRKAATQQHQPLPTDYLNSVTAQIKDKRFDIETFQQRLVKASVFRKIRLAYALNFRLNNSDSIVYRVRSGRGWATEFEWPTEHSSITEQALKVVLKSIADSIRNTVSGKTIYIPGNVHYTLPATEKQFTGCFPNGSYFCVPEDLIVGIHWTNTEKKRVDLDLSVIGASGKTGWDAAYRSDENSVLFSGDMTDAPLPDGATELFYIKKEIDEPKVLLANYYNFHKDDQVGMRLLVARESAKNFGANYMVDPNNIVGSADLNINKRQNVLGLIVSVNGQTRVYFSNVSIGNSISARNNHQNRFARHYLLNSVIHSIGLADVLVQAGATVVDQLPDDQEQVINLAPSSLDKSSILRLFI